MAQNPPSNALVDALVDYVRVGIELAAPDHWNDEITNWLEGIDASCDVPTQRENAPPVVIGWITQTIIDTEKVNKAAAELGELIEEFMSRITAEE